jgi:FMN reductase
MRCRIVGISANVQLPSKTRTLVETIGTAAAQASEADWIIHDLADAGPRLGAAFSRSELPAEVERILRDIETANALIVGSPVYKGSYTGLFKHLFDFVELTTLRNIPIAPTATGGGARHALVVEQHLRPQFGFFEALTIPTAVYASDADFEGGRLTNAAVRDRTVIAAGQLARLLSLTPRRSAHPFSVRLASVS